MRSDGCGLTNYIMISGMAVRASVFRRQLSQVRVGGEHIGADARGEVNDDVAGQKQCVGSTYRAPLAELVTS